MQDWRSVARSQDGVVSRQQLHRSGLVDHDVARLLRRRELSRVHAGVYVDDTGPITSSQRRWAAVLACWPAALSYGTALGRTDDPTVHVAVDGSRRIVAPSGVTVHRIERFDQRVRWQVSPPRLRVEDAALYAAASARDDLSGVAVLADVCGAGLTTAERLLATLESLPRLPRRRWLAEVLVDVAAGTCSVLEHGFLTRVERAHGLPRGSRQAVAVDGRVSRRDVLYRRQGLVVELDGRLFHASAEQHGHDLDRDLLSAARRTEETVRLGWHQVFTSPCLTARLLGEVLVRRGWRGTPSSCPMCGGSRSPGERDTPQTPGQP